MNTHVPDHHGHSSGAAPQHDEAIVMGLVLLLSVAAAVLYGTADFLGGLISRRTHYTVVGLIGQAAGALGATGAALTSNAPLPDGTTLLWGMGAGIGGAVGTLALYRGLAHGRMNIAGPLSAVTAAGIPVLVDLVFGAHLTTPTTLGICLAVPGIWLVSSGTGSRRSSGGVGDGLLAGLGFAGLFICLNRAGDLAGLWPVATSQVMSAVILGTVALVSWVATRRPVTSAPSPWMALWPGVLAVSGTILYFIATHKGTLTAAAVLTSLYPAFTVILAALVLRERTSLLHSVGLALCAASVGAFVTG
ncbi:EamA family transporter [Nonomuraea sp. NPDC059023]|uniref:EamA family transporter n=1 Tax=unclassified Nonomuraea TaxID=2593643 RepID=UPI0036BF33B9